MIDSLLNELRRRDIHIWAEGDRLKYNAPPDALTGDLLAQLRAHKEQILQHCLMFTDQPLTSIPKADRSRPLPLSFSQQRMWFLWRLAPDSPAYNIPNVIKFTGPLNVEALVETLRLIHRRHEVLRTYFVETHEDVVQVIDETSALDVPVIDLTEGSLEQRSQQARRLIEEQTAKPVDLSKKAPFTVCIYRLNDTLHWCLIKLHHALFDGWSNRVFMEEFDLLYQSLASGQPYELPELPIQYVDFAAWQKERFQGPVREKLMAYWRQQLSGDLAPLRLPTDRPASLARSMRGDVVPFRISPRLVSDLSKLGQRQRATMFMTIMCALRILLYRYSGNPDFLIGTPTIRRQHKDTEPLIGYFGNTLVLRNALKLGDTYLDVLARERQTALEGYEYQEIPFDRLVEEIAPNRTLTRSPLFQVMFLFGERAPASYPLGQLEVEFVELVPTTAKFDLGLWVMQTQDGGLSGHFEYSSDLFERETVQRITTHFEMLLKEMAENPESEIRQTVLLTPAEQQMILRDWNETSRPVKLDRCLHELFADQVAANPQATAIVYGAEKTTYAQLDEQANRLARSLLQQGVKPEQLVAVCLQRSPALIASLLAVLKVGAAYVPIDPNYPTERVKLILEDGGIDFLLTDSSLAANLPAGNWQLIIADANPADGEGLPPVSVRTDPNSLAYVIYTSGSTGHPKGVMIEHRSALALLDWAYSCYRPEELAVVLAATSTSFDLSIFEIFVPLCGGYSIVLANSILDLPSLPARDTITLINTVPSVMRALLRLPEASFPPSLQVVNLAGEALETHLVDQVYRQTRVKKVFDLYGPTEATTYATFKLRLPQEPPVIGRPISNTRAYILDRNGLPVPVGVIGELCLAGEGLARGYLNRPDLTAERFVTPRWRGIAEKRLYCTGDLVRYKPNGAIEYSGRDDDQVKIRGYRIEPNEVKGALLKIPGITDAVVAGQQNTDGGTHLLAYVITDDPQFSAPEAKSQLARHLPDYMIPSIIRSVESFPLNPNGKIDWARLDQASSTEIQTEVAMARTGTERELVEIWKDVLNLENVGIHDSFFDLGGHSIAAMLVLARVNRAFEIDLPLPTIFQYPTIYELAAQVESRPRGSVLPPVMAHASDDAPATLLQQHLWLIHHMSEKPAFLNIWQYMNLRGTLSVSIVNKVLHELVNRHPILRSTFYMDGDQLRQRISSEALPDLYFDDLSDVPDELRKQVLATVCHELGYPFNLHSGPCFRFEVVRLSPDSFLLIFVMHHIIIDEWSLGILFSEFATLYAAFSNDLRPHLPAESPSFTDYALWELECRNNGLFDQQFELWKEILSQPLARLTFTWNDEESDEEQIENHVIEIDEQLVKQLQVVTKVERSSLFVVFLSALVRLLQQQTEESDIRVSTNVARRHQPELENVIGPLTDTLILRTQLPADHDALSALRLVRSNFIQAWGLQSIPFEEMASRLESESDIARADLAQVFFLFQDEDTEAPPLPGLSVDTGDTALTLGDDFFTSAAHAYDIILYLKRNAGAISGNLTLKGQLQDGAIGRKLVNHYCGLLEELAAAVKQTEVQDDRTIAA